VNQFTASLWGDEGFSAILSMKPVPEIIKILMHDTSPPLYNLTEHLAFQIFGTSEIVIRSLSFSYYCLATLFIYLIVSYLWDKKSALLASSLSFFNPFFFIYAFEGRMYSIMALGVTASMYFFVRLYFLPDKIKKAPIFLILGYVFSTTWALYSHHFAIFIIFIQGFWWLTLIIQKSKKRLWILISFLLTAIAYTPWLYPLYLQTKMIGSGFWLGTPTQEDLINLIFDYLAQGQNSPFAKPTLYLVLLTLTIRIWTRNIKKTFISVTWFMGPILITWIISRYFQSIFYNRYLLYTIPAAMILVATNRRRYISIILTGIILGLFIRIDYYYFTHPTKAPFREYATYIKEQRRGDDYLIIGNAGNHKLWETKYYGIPAPIYVPDGSDLPFFVGTALMEKSDIISAIPGRPNRIGVISSGHVDEVVIPGYTKTTEIVTFGDLKFQWLEK